MKKINNFWYTDKQYIEILEKRLKKAIAYIEENTTDPEFVVSGELQDHQVIELLKILRGGE